MPTSSPSHSTSDSALQAEDQISRWRVIVVTYNSESELAKIWANIPPELRKMVVQVDNGSSDSSVEVGRRLFPVVLSQENLGLSAGNNAGARIFLGTKPEYLLFANPDLHIDYEGLVKLQNEISLRDSIVAPRLLSQAGEEQASARGWPTPMRQIGNRLRLRAGMSPSVSYIPHESHEKQNVPWVMGASIAMSRNVFERLGGWNAKFFLYYEDVDLCVRAHRFGINVRQSDAVLWRHDWSRASLRPLSRAWRYHIRSAIRFYVSNPDFMLGVPRWAKSLDIEAK